MGGRGDVRFQLPELGQQVIGAARERSPGPDDDELDGGPAW